MYATYANEYLGLYEKVKQSYGVVLTVFEKFHHKIIRGVRKKPDLARAKGAVVHARVHPTTLEEITDEWGHHQLDIFGLFLFKTGDLQKQGFRVLRSNEHVQVVKDICRICGPRVGIRSPISECGKKGQKCTARRSAPCWRA